MRASRMKVILALSRRQNCIPMNVQDAVAHIGAATATISFLAE